VGDSGDGQSTSRFLSEPAVGMSVLGQRVSERVWNQDAPAPELRKIEKESNDRAEARVSMLSASFRPVLSAG
jgi:hypothetical protein